MAWCCRSRRCCSESQTLIDTRRAGVRAAADLAELPADPALACARSTRRAKQARGAKAIGTTGRGIGPAYEDKVARRALRVADLFHPARFADQAGRECSTSTTSCCTSYFKQPPVDFQRTLDALLAQGERIKPLVVDVTQELAAAARRRAPTCCSRARRARCSTSTTAPIPFVTSSNTTARRRLDGHRPRAARFRLRAGHREGLRHARRRGSVPDRAVR